MTAPVEPDRPMLDARQLMIAEGMDRLRQDRGLIDMMLGDPSKGGSAFETQLLAAFGPERET